MTRQFYQLSYCEVVETGYTFPIQVSGFPSENCDTSYPVSDSGTVAPLVGVGSAESRSGQSSLLRGRGRWSSSSSSRFTIILSFFLNKAPSPNDLLVADLGLLEGSVPGDNEPYPESFEDREVSLVAVNLAGGER